MHKSGFIGILGKPNVGKSTLLNEIIGEKIAIATRKPQTTRNRITGVKTTEKGQFIFLDTPGIHHTRTPLNRLMVATSVSTIEEVDIILFMTEANSDLNDDDHFIIKTLEGAKIPVILAINKIDLIEKNSLLLRIDAIRHMLSFADIVPVSALRGFNVGTLLDVIWNLLPEGPRYFPEDIITESSERFLAAEIIREKITLLTSQEIPYSSAVVVDSFREEERKNLIHIQATINVEKNSQKGIVIGVKGSMLKRIGTQARLEMERFFAARIYLKLFVKVRKDWTRDSKMLLEFGYRKT
ncbi:MAG: GTPase Era [Deltaproteobacteria bacterium]|nr:GTPase Era [Deltaproteobacteria bacterium]